MASNELTPREKEALIAYLQSASAKEAAVKLGISPRTVKEHLRRISVKLNAAGARDLPRAAAAAGIVRLEVV